MLLKGVLACGVQVIMVCSTEATVGGEMELLQALQGAVADAGHAHVMVYAAEPASPAGVSMLAVVRPSAGDIIHAHPTRPVVPCCMSQVALPYHVSCWVCGECGACALLP